MSPEEFLRRMPKAEVHLHLEGTVRPETLWELAQAHRVALPADTLHELRGLYQFQGFDTFLALWLAMHACFQDAAAYERMVDDFLLECARQNVRYVEAHFTPFNHERMPESLGGRRALEIVSQRLQRAEAQGGPVVRLILDIPSEALPEAGEYTARLLEELADPVVVALGLGGPEEGFPRLDAAPFFARARAAGYPVVAHAGETFGAAHVRDAVEVLGARRVQHGVRAVEDPGLLRMLAEREICCDLALTSNTLLTIYRDLGGHPLRRMLEAGVPLTLSTDDPAFFNTDLTREFLRARAELGLSLDELWAMNVNGLRYGLAETPVRRRLLREFEAERQRLLATDG